MNRRRYRCQRDSRRRTAILIVGALLASLLLVNAIAPSATASVSTQAAREAAEFALQKFGKGAAKEGAEQLAVRIERAAAAHGDEVLAAVRKAGPQALHLAEQAGAKNGGTVLRVAARYGDQGLWIVENPKTLKLVADYGDDAAAALFKHPGIAEDVIAANGKLAATAMKDLSREQALDLAKLSASGELAKLGRSEEILATVGKYGDGGMNFIWKHKAALATAAVLATFLADPQPYIDGTKELAQIGVEAVVKPITDLPGQVATEAARNTDWTPVVLTLVAIAGALVALRMYLRRRAAR